MQTMPARRIQLSTPSQPDADWTARLALGGAAGFTLLLLAFGLMLYNAWPQMSGVRQSVGAIDARSERIASGQEKLSREVASLRNDLRGDRSERADREREQGALRDRIGELAGTVADLRARADRLEPAAAPAPSPAPDASIQELRSRLDALQRRLDQLAAAPQNPAPPPAAVTPRDRGAYPVEEVEREVREMQEVIRRQHEGVRNPIATAAARGAVEPPARPATPSIADPLAPLTSKTRPRIAPARPGMAETALVSWVPPTASAQQPTDLPAGRSAPEPRVSRVGINSGMKAIGPIALPFDMLGNLVVAIGEGLDHLFTGREYLPRQAPGGEPATASRAR